jgi:transposase-like protein
MPRISPYYIHLSDTERAQLESQARKYTSPYYSVLRAKMILLAAQGQRNDQIAASLSVPRQMVSKWRKRFFEERLPGLEAEARTGRPPVFPPTGRRAG